MKADQFAVIYQFNILEDDLEEFISSWENLTELIYKHEGSLGSRLHKKSNTEYLAYARWPSRQHWEQSGSNLPPEAKKYSKQMHEACTKIETLYELDLVSDLLKD
ncbi:MAG: antibiotic biosynthesis monooxygenase [Bacteroidia bacterium]